MEALILTFWLFTKHFVIDFPAQPRYQYSNKGTYGHPGGLLHSGLQGLGTFLVVIAWGPLIALIVALIDAVVHYHVDWAKVNINKKLSWGPTTHEQFWWMVGFDQYLHTLTYLWIVYVVIF